MSALDDIIRPVLDAMGRGEWADRATSEAFVAIADADAWPRDLGRGNGHRARQCAYVLRSFGLIRTPCCGCGHPCAPVDLAHDECPSCGVVLYHCLGLTGGSWWAFGERADGNRVVER